MTAYEIIQRARGLADLQSTDFISYNDILNSLNESYRDIYSEITESNDDYFLQEEIITIDPAYLVSNGNNWEYELPLPADFYKLRYIDYKYNGNWQPVNRFNLGAKDMIPGQPQYRFRGQKLWILGTFSTSGSEIRLGYYPPAETLSVPDNAKTYLATLPAYQGPTIASPVFVESGQNYLYIIGLVIKAESKTTGVTSTLYTSASAISNLAYYKGYLYFLNNTGNIMRGTTDLLATVTPAAITTSNDITSFTIQNNTIFYTTSTQTKSCTLTGGSVSVIGGVVQTHYHFYKSYPLYVTAGNLILNAVTIYSGVQSVSAYGDFIYLLDTLGNVRKLELDITIISAPVILNDWILAENVSTLGDVEFPFLPIIEDQQAFLAISVGHDSDLAYPLNLVPEMISYQAAIDFRRKQNADPSLLMLRLKELTATFKESIIRDSYQVERIKNYTAQGAIFSYGS